MKKVITALLNAKVNEKLKQYKEIEIVMNDIQYQDGIIEALEEKEEIDYIIVSELLPGIYNIKELIEEIKKIKIEVKIILILEKENKELENYLCSKGNIYFFYNNEIEIKEIAELIINEQQKDKLEEEIKELKKMILEKEVKKEENDSSKITQNQITIITKEEKIEIEEEIENEYKSKKIKNRFIQILKKEPIKEETKIFTIIGNTGSGKSIFVSNIAKQLEKMKNKILIIDLDFFNNSVQILFGIKKQKERKQIQDNNEIESNELKKCIYKINSKIDLLSNLNSIYSALDEYEILKRIEEIKEKYDVILIDTEITNEEKYLNIFINISNKIIFITEPNILEIKKSQNFLQKYKNNYQIEKDKIYIVFNKIKDDSISLYILKDVYKQYNILGKIDFIKNYNTLINRNLKENLLERKIKDQYKKISKDMLKNNKLKSYYISKIEEN